MSYEKNTWESGDVITSEKLNNIENGCDLLNPVTVNLSLTSLTEAEADLTNLDIVSGVLEGRQAQIFLGMPGDPPYQIAAYITQVIMFSETSFILIAMAYNPSDGNLYKIYSDPQGGIDNTTWIISI